MRACVTLLLVTASSGCTFAPCLNKQCSPTANADASGDFEKDLVGQWFSDDGRPATFVEFRADGTGRTIVVCDKGLGGVTPGETSTFAYHLDGGVLSQGALVREIISLSATELVIHETAQNGATVHFVRATCTGAPFTP